MCDKPLAPGVVQRNIGPNPRQDERGVEGRKQSWYWWGVLISKRQADHQCAIVMIMPSDPRLPARILAQKL